MQGRSFLQRTLAGILVTVSVALFAAPANAAGDSWTGSSVSTGELSTYSYSGTATQDASVRSFTATVPAGTTAPGEKAVQMNGSGGIAAPHAAGQTSNTIEMIMRVRLDDWTPSSGAMLASKWQGSGNWSYMISVTASGDFAVRISNTGSNSFTSTVVPTVSFADGSTQWIKFVYRADYGADRRYTSLFTSTNGIDWGTAVGTLSQSTARSPYAGMSTLKIGQGDGTQGVGSIRGAVYFASLTDGVAGTTFATMNPNENTTGAASWTGVDGSTWSSSTAGAVNGTRVANDLSPMSVTGLASGGRAYFAYGYGEIAYVPPADQTVTTGTPVGMALAGLKNTTTPGTYSAVFKTNTNAALIDFFNTNQLLFINPQGVSFDVGVAPLFSFSISPRATECSLQSGLADATYVTPASAGASNLGSFNPSTIRSSAHDLTVATNARGGAGVTIRGAEANNNMRSTTAQPFIDSAVSPTISASTFGYTVSNTHNGLNATWKALSDSPTEVAFSSSFGFVSQCVGQTIAVAQTTPAGTYSATVVYTAVPTF